MIALSSTSSHGCFMMFMLAILFQFFFSSHCTIAFLYRPQLHRHQTRPSFIANRSTQNTVDHDPPETIATSSSALPVEFSALGIASQLLPAIRSKDWSRPTPIQQLAIPHLLQAPSSSSSSAVWCEAPTGGGKTACFALPLLQNIIMLQQQNRLRASSTNKNKNINKNGGKVTALILCPTRELANQIGSVVKGLASKAATTGSESAVRGQRRNGDVNIMIITGGVPREPQLTALAAICSPDGDSVNNIINNKAMIPTNVDIVIATPGRLVDLLQFYNNGDQTDVGNDDQRVATDAALEKRLLTALDAQGKRTDQSLSLDQIQKLKLDRLDDEGRSALPFLLNNLQYLVIDEADRLLGRTFESEIDGLLDLLPNVPNTWLFSATFPKHVELRVDSVLKRIQQQKNNGDANAIVRISCTNADRVRQSDEETSTSLAKKLEHVQSPTVIQQISAASTIALRTIRLEKRDRTQVLRQLLEEHQDEWDRVLVFVSTRYSAEHVSRKLRRAGIESAELHGKLDQDARNRRLQDLTRGKIRVLIATDVASRGLDIVGLPAVVNYDLPRSPADFVHRIGRTGRAGRRGTAVTFAIPSSEAHLDLIEKRFLTEPLERETLSGFEPDEEQWRIEAEGSRLAAPGAMPSKKGLAHDRMFGGIKSRRKSKKDKLREAQAALATSSASLHGHRS